ncbi:Alpha,alpha-trehalase [Purpureocillium takamizusanense]|uniref:Trehalase n=1 Tax=Purpureocillium takamizusanense TaxID=2060973 RepID=A0A9Q8QTL5_9HYPO|nr:Alpha,alpha-trehalase [Purpureocillium takamizusanense]UNI25061.1 Alpha,alpha-trehalase [Purpureocillium takamizusanense]
MAPARRLAAVLAATASTATALYVNGSVVAPCDSPIYCHGSILEEVELARPFEDSKHFVDMPARRPLREIQAAFDQLPKPLRNDSILHDFLETYFDDAGGELKAVPKEQLHTDAEFLKRIEDPVTREFVEKVVGIWPDLTRSYAGADSSSCADCPNSFIPINRTFVIPGGRFREPYYWDTYWVLEGLLRTRGAFTEIARNAIDNFLDLVERFGFVPNGARIYYLNRSQPPMLSQMVRAYLAHTNDTSILDRALPLLVREHEFWTRNRSVEVTVADHTYTLSRYAVDNTQPRPESFREDYVQATNESYWSPTSGIIYPPRAGEALNDSQRALLYSDLAAAAETGWDFSSRWLARPDDSARDVYFPLRSLNTRNVVPVCLNSILYGNERAIGDFFAMRGNDSARQAWHEAAERRSEAMHALMWNETHFSYFDYNMTSSSQQVYVRWSADDDVDDDMGDTNDVDNNVNGRCKHKQNHYNHHAPPLPPPPPPGHKVFFHVAQFFPFWTGAAPRHLRDNPHAVRTAFSRVARYLDRLPGGVPATNLRSGQQWDEPNVWPPLMHVLIQGLLNTPATFGVDDPAHRDVQDLALRLAQRYLDSTFCTWWATGGSTAQTPRLGGLPDRAVGAMFEKYSARALVGAGAGGEYEVVEGFGWTNGLLILVADIFATDLKRPDCGDIQPAITRRDDDHQAHHHRERSAVELHPADAGRTKRFGRRAAAADAAADGAKQSS